MLNIGKILAKYKFDNYWMITHNIKKYVFEKKDNVWEIDKNHEEMHVLYIEVDGKIGRVQFPNLEQSAVEIIVDEYFSKRIYYVPISRKKVKLDIPYLNNYKIMPKNKVVENECKKIRLEKIDVKDIYIYDEIEYNFDGIIRNVQREKNYVYAQQKQPPFMVIFKETEIYEDMMEDIIKFEECDRNAQIELLTGETTPKNLRFAPKVFKYFVQLLINSMNGMQIIRGNSIFRDTDFGTKIFTNEISIIENWKLENDNIFDDEGIRVKTKNLVKNGVLVDGINNLVSASVLGTSAGDYIYNYIMNNSMIEPRNIMFKLKNKRKFYDNYDAYVTEILGEQIVLDNQNGNIHFSCIGIDKNHELKKYCINTTLIGMFNNIVWAGESKYVVDNYCLPEIIVDFRR